jgi:hypothetical protein
MCATLCAALCAEPRDVAEIDALLKSIRQLIAESTYKLSQEQVQSLLKGHDGLTKLYYALSNDYMPDDLDAIRDVLPDIMHILFAGISRKEPARMLKLLFKPGAGYVKSSKPWEELNACIDQLRLPKGKKISRLQPFKPDIGFDELKLDLNSSEMMHFTLHSVSLIEPLLTAKGLVHPAWVAWLKHREIVQIALQHSFDIQIDPGRLTTAIEEHARLYQEVCATC